MVAKEPEGTKMDKMASQFSLNLCFYNFKDILQRPIYNISLVRSHLTALPPKVKFDLKVKGHLEVNLRSA